MTIIDASIVWKQTADERYETDTNRRAITAIKALGFDILSEEGGCSFDPDDPLPADNGVYIKGTQEALDGLRAALTPILGHPETIDVRTYEVPA